MLGEDLREMLGPAELATGVFDDDWTPLLTQLRMSGLSELAEALEHLAGEVLPQAHELARGMDAVAYLRNGGPRDAFYDIYARDDLATHEACALESRQDVARGVMRIVGTLRTLAKGEVGGSIAGVAMPKRSQKSRPRRCTRDGQDRARSSQPSDDQYEWARQIDLVKASNQVLGEGMLNKGVLSRACTDGHVESNGKTGRSVRVRVRSFLNWITRQNKLGADEATQIRNAVIGEMSSRNS